MIDILVVSHACHTAINRTIYSRLMLKHGWNLELLIPESLSFPDGERIADPQTRNDPPIHRLPITSTKPRTYSFDGMRALLKKRQPRLILVDCDPASRLSLEIGRWAAHNNAYMICQSCDNLSRRISISFKRAQLRGLISSLIIHLLTFLVKPYVAHILVISTDGEKVFRELGYSGKITRTPLGFDPILFKPNDEERNQVRKQLKLNSVVIAYFGRLTVEKGVHILLQALGKISHLQWQFMIDEFVQSKNNYHDQVHMMIKQLGLLSRTIFFDSNHEEIHNYMNAADIVVLPSIETPKWKEQYGRVAPESMACGKMVIASDSGTLPELIGDAGIIVPEGDIDALAKVLSDVIQNQDKWNYFGEKAIERSHRLFSLDQQVEILHKVVNNTLHGY